MRKVIFIAAVSALVAAPALADFGDIICSWDMPYRSSSADDCRGLAWDGRYVWCARDTYLFDDVMFRCRASDGSVVSSFIIPFRSKFNGMCYRQFRGENVLELVVHDNNNPLLARINFRGQVVDRLGVSLPPGSYVWSVCYDGANNWVVVPEYPERNIVYKLNTSGSAVSSFVVRGMTGGRGIDRQHDFFWISVNYTEGRPGFFGALKTKANGSIAASFGGWYQTVYDCCYENNHVWIVTSSIRVLCVDVSNAPAVAPASVGRIKALFK